MTRPGRPPTAHEPHTPPTGAPHTDEQHFIPSSWASVLERKARAVLGDAEVDAFLCSGMVVVDDA